MIHFTALVVTVPYVRSDCGLTRNENSIINKQNQYHKNWFFFQRLWSHQLGPWLPLRFPFTIFALFIDLSDYSIILLSSLLSLLIHRPWRLKHSYRRQCWRLGHHWSWTPMHQLRVGFFAFLPYSSFVRFNLGTGFMISTISNSNLINLILLQAASAASASLTGMPVSTKTSLTCAPLIDHGYYSTRILSSSLSLLIHLPWRLEYHIC